MEVKSLGLENYYQYFSFQNLNYLVGWKNINMFNGAWMDRIKFFIDRVGSS